MGYRLIKRSFDLCASLFALVVLSPLFLIVSIGIKASSRGPVLYKSERIGLNGIPFTMFKFRSMHIKQEGTIESKYIVNGSRIFKFGSFIRKSKLDELPQLINVFLAHMSVVGPRPYPRAVVDREYTGENEIILSVKPGLSCYDSLFDYTHGELFVTDEKEYAERIIPVRTELAKKYVNRKSIKTDLYIILRTIKLIWEIVIMRKTKFAYDRIEQETICEVTNRKKTPMHSAR